MTRGNWIIHEAIISRWAEFELDAVFRGEWASSDTRQVLHDGEALPSPPGPYCVYEIGVPGVIGHMGAANTDNPKGEHQLTTVPITFTVHGKATQSESAKAVCIKLAKKVAEAYNPKKRLNLSGTADQCVEMFKGADFGMRSGDDEYQWVLQYSLTVDSIFEP